MSLSVQELQRFAERLAATPELWQPFVRHSDDVRIYAQIWDDEDVNAWLICWSEDQDTGFHDHDDSAAAIVVIEGQVREERLGLIAEPQVRIAGRGTTLHVEPTAIHRVLHSGRGPAVTIHAYSPPLTRTGVYRIGPDGQLRRAARSYEHELRAEPAVR